MSKIQKKIIEESGPEDVSEPRPVRKESEILAENRAMFRRMWIRDHLVHIFVIVGILLVALVFLGVRFYHQSANPLSRFMSAAAKNFSSPFSFEMTVSDGDNAVMEYKGAADVNRSSHAVNILYDAKYTGYGYTAAVRSDGKSAVSGSFYQDKWRVRDCTAKMQDFFDFDTDFQKGVFDAGAFLRFTQMTTEYSSDELAKFFETFRDRMSTTSTVAVVTSKTVKEGTEYSYSISLKELLKMVVEDGAPVFYRSSDYDAFKARYEESIRNIRESNCSFRFTVDNAGYLSEMRLKFHVGDKDYSYDCMFSDFGTATVELPEGFTKAADALLKEDK